MFLWWHVWTTMTRQRAEDLIAEITAPSAAPVYYGKDGKRIEP